MGRSRMGAHWALWAALSLAAQSGCSSKEPEPQPEPIVIAENARVLDAQGRQGLSSFDPVGGALVFSTVTPQLAALQPGDIIVSEPSAAAPYGLLRKVSSTSPSGSGLVVQTTQGTLKEVILQGTLHAQGTLSPVDLEAFESAPGVVRPALKVGFPIDVVVVDLDDNPSTTGDQLHVTGSAGFDVGYDVAMGWKVGYDPPFDIDVSTKFIALLYVTQYAQLGVVASGPLPSFTKEVSLGSHPFTPITFFVGPIPVVLVPTVSVSLTASGALGTPVSYGVDETIGFEAGVSKQFGEGFHPVFEFTPTASGTGPSLTPTYGEPSFGMGVGLKTRGSLRLYGLVGPFVDLRARGYLSGGVGQAPPWQIRGGVGADVGVEVDLVFWDYDWSHTIYDQYWDIVQATGNTPPIIASVTPKPGTKVQLGQPVDLWAIAGDVEDGYSCCTRSWVSSMDGAIGTEGPYGMKHTFTTPGLRNLTVTAMDSSGATVTANTTVEVVNTPPVVTLAKPAPGATWYAGYPLYIDGWATDGNQPCSTLTLAWSSSNPGDVTPAASCTGGASVTFATAGTRTLSLKATDTQGASDTKSVSVSIVSPPANIPPDIMIDSPKSGSSFGDYQYVTLSARIRDVDDQTLYYAWFNATAGKQITAVAMVTGTNGPDGATVTDTLAATDALTCSGTSTLELRVWGGGNLSPYTSAFVDKLWCQIVPK
jgi:hypothetical protein